MNSKSTSLENILNQERFPRSSRYDPHWVLENQMGLNPLWLTEWVCEELALQPDMRVLDLGCGKGLSSIFLAKEYGVQVWAADLWIKPTENYARICQAGVENLVYPIEVDARSLPFAEAYFDAVICTDAYIYFGTDDLYLAICTDSSNPAGRLGFRYLALCASWKVASRNTSCRSGRKSAGPGTRSIGGAGTGNGPVW